MPTLELTNPHDTPSETVLYRCGPMGMAISFRRCGVFVPSWQNCTEIVATDRRLCGVGATPWFVVPRRRKNRGKVVFSVPYSAMHRAERADYLLNHALWVCYSETRSEKEISIEAGLFWHEHITRLEEILAAHAGPNVLRA